MLVVFAWLAGCAAHGTFTCAQDSQCGAGGRCEPAGYCSFPDSTCGSGRRYDQYAGAGYESVCVGEEMCQWPYPASNIDVCNAGAVQPTFHPAQGNTYTIDTTDGSWTIGEETHYDGPPTTVVTQAGGGMVRVLNVRGFEIDSSTRLQTTGPLPLVIVVHGMATVAGSIVAQGTMSAGDCIAANTGGDATGGKGGGGGGGGGYGGNGARGGMGSSVIAGGVGGMTSGDPMLTPLGAGCAGVAGGDPIGGTTGGDGGRPGGGVQLTVENELTVSGNVDAHGNGGRGGQPNSSGAGGGGGGGAGGSILLEANVLQIDSNGRICANGGAGGEGGGASAGGGDGNDGTCSATQGATGASTIAGAGGGGGGGFGTTPPDVGGSSTTAPNGAGGGGGSVGRIRLRGINTRAIEGTISPAASN